MKKVLMSLLCFVMVVTLTACDSGKKKTSPKKENQPVKEELASIALDDQVVEDLTFENFAITPDANENQVVFFSITNNTNSNINIKDIIFTLYSEKATVFSLQEVIDKTLSPGESVDITEVLDVNLSGVDEVKYVVNK